MTSQILNGTQLTLTALQESDQAVFERVLGRMLKSGIDPAAFTRGTVRKDPAAADYAFCDVTVAREKANVSLWPYQGTQQIRYKRVGLPALAARFGTVVRADTPISARELFATYLTANGLYDRSKDIVDKQITAFGNVTFNVTEGDNFLLYGTTTLTFKPKQRQLVDVIKDTKLLGFRVVTDFAPLPKQVFVNQVTADNALLYPLEMNLLTLGTPQKLSGYQYDNTKIKLTATGDGSYLGSVDLTYTRYDFGWSTNGAQLLVTGPTKPTTAYMVSKVFELTGFPVSVDDVVVETYANVPVGTVETLTITFKADNLRYAGELTIDYKAV